MRMASEVSAIGPGESFSCLLVEDDAAFASMVARVIRELGGLPVICGTLGEALRASSERRFDLFLLDNHLPDGKVYDAYRRLCRGNPEAPAIMITGMANLAEAIDLTRNGLFDYLAKPVDLQAVETCLRRALLRVRSKGSPSPEGEFSLGESLVMREVGRQLREAARHIEAAVLITGESGVGKDVAVRCLHQWTFGGGAGASPAPYVPVNCAAVPAEMFEAELFGAERGAYTGADRRRIGLAAAAQGGTLFLDEIGEVPLVLQPKLLRFLESREFRPLGGVANQRFTGRLVAATHRSLHDEVAAGRFREDLLFRIEVFSIVIPPLRERREDLPGLAEQTLAHLARKYGREVPLLREADLQSLREHDFPGNVRELRNILERSLLRTPPESRWLVLDTTWRHRLRGRVAPAPTALEAPSPRVEAPAADPLPAARAGLTPLEAQEYRLIRSTLAETSGGIRRAASRLGLSPQALLRRLEKWPELRPPSEPS